VVVPSFAHSNRILEAAKPDDIAARADVVMTALPHGVGTSLIASVAKLGKVVIDLSADFRLRDPELYAEWYRTPHPAPALLREAVYGLPEFWRNDILNASLIACPGCYPTATTLAIAPLLMERLVEPQLIVDAKSGTSGAGRAPAQEFQFSEVGEGIRPYKVAGAHRHTPEMEQALSAASGQAVTLTFSPHLVPMSRGILACVYARPTDPDAPESTYLEALERAYGYEPFITVLSDRLPDTSHVRGSNRVHVTARYDRRINMVVAMCVIDNLVKGAAGQAIQCLNLVQGYPETEGLDAVPLFP
jgi:N-acetyl-gamma-glutamyl-phosphate reductase